MKRWTLRITICLILGVVTTVGVAWGLDINADDLAARLEGQDSDRYGTFWVRPDRRLTQGGEQGIQLSPGHVSISYIPGINVNWLKPPRRIDAERYEAAIPTWSRFRDPARVSQALDLSTGNSFVNYRETAAGWPIKAMASSYLWVLDFDNAGNGPFHIAVDALGAPLLVEAGDGREIELPLRPVFPDFLINTLFYAAIWFGLFFVMGRTRRFIRTRRGRCPRCGYDLRGEFDDGCPECGWGRRDE